MRGHCGAVQGDSTLKQVKDLDVVLGAETAVVILDDTAGVWPSHQQNLLQVERYIYFPACVRRFGLDARSLLEQGRDEDEQRGMLASALCILQQAGSCNPPMPGVQCRSMHENTPTVVPALWESERMKHFLWHIDISLLRQTPFLHGVQ